MWSLITVSSAGHLHRTKSLAGAAGSRPVTPRISICVSDTFPYSRWCCVKQLLRSGQEQSYLTRPTRFMMNNERSVFVKSP